MIDNNDTPRVGYMCQIAYDHEAGETTVKVYHSIDALRAAHPACDECGIVRVNISLAEIVQECTI